MTITHSIGEYSSAILAALASPQLLRATFAGTTRFQKSPIKRAAIRPVDLRGTRLLQVSRFDGRKDISSNHSPDDLPAVLADVLAAGFANVHITTTTEELDLRLTKKGQLLIGRKTVDPSTQPNAKLPLPIPAAHNRVKDLPLPEGNPDPLLAALGILDRHHRVRPTMRDKFTQINEFLKLLDHVLPDLPPSADGEVVILDCGCGSSHLTLATAHFLHHVKKIPARVVGIDINPEVLEKSRARAAELTTHFPELNIQFRQGAIGSINDLHADIVLALHACDTATDDAIAQAIRSNARLLLAVPCCHQDINARLHIPALAPLHHHGILHQRQADLITDTFRALILKVMGYRAEVIEFISPEHTARNLMIRALRVRSSQDPAAIKEYQQFKQFTGITPYLEGALKETFLASPVSSSA
ncbi:MAG TPA: SAM-dependent methyltransferase [Phycisphaerae bacterium]|jgi:SAM-dependent methyltransferase